MTDHSANFKCLTKGEHMRELVLRAGRENCLTNYHYSEELGKKMEQLKKIYDKKAGRYYGFQRHFVTIYILGISLRKLKT